MGVRGLLSALTDRPSSPTSSACWGDRGREPEQSIPPPALRVDAGTLSIRRGKTGIARRTVHVPASTVGALRAHRKEQAERRLLCGAAWADNDLVVDRGDGEPVIAASLSAGFARIADSVGLGDVRLHDLRHGFAVALLREGINVKVVAEALGHSRASFTLDTYMHVLPGMGEQVASAIETALAASSAAARPSE